MLDLTRQSRSKEYEQVIIVFGFPSPAARIEAAAADENLPWRTPAARHPYAVCLVRPTRR